jgi:hypothetical protein
MLPLSDIFNVPFPEHWLKVIFVNTFKTLATATMSRARSVSIVSDHGLDDQGSIPGSVEGFFF